MNKIIKPNFFLIGAPRCGTTAMDSYLRSHPDVFMGPKELTYFGSDLMLTEKSEKRARDERTYLASFSDWKGQKIIGDSSVWYLNSKKAANEIKAFSPDARILIMLRNPVDMIYSYYFDLLYNGNEDIPDFEEALAAEADRKQGKRLPQTVHNVGALYYRDAVKFADQIGRYLRVFGREKMLVTIYDDFRQDTADVYRRVLTFLEIDPDFAPEFNVMNANRVRRSHWLLNITNFPSPGQQRLRQTIPPRVRRQIGRTIRRWNTKHIKRPPMNAELRRRLKHEFKPEVQKLSQLLDRDLMHWCE